jgi:hypothetical protein
MSEEFANKKDRKNFKPKRGLGSAVTRQRRKIAESVRAQEDARNQAAKAAARAEIERSRAKGKSETFDMVGRWHNSILNSVVHGQAGVMRAMHLSQPIAASLTDAPQVMAYTDFRQVVVQWPKRDMPKMGAPRENMLRTVARIKGVCQHEIGHLRFTTPWPVIDKAVANRGTHSWSADTMHKAWNALEDQRMEACVVSVVPRIGNYFNPLITDLILKQEEGSMDNGESVRRSWFLLAGRQYLGKNVRRMSYQLFDDLCLEKGVAHGASTWAGLVRDYVGAKSPQAIYDAVVAAVEFMALIDEPMPGGMDDHGRMGNGNGIADPSGTATKQTDDSDELANGGGGDEGDETDTPSKHKDDYEDRLKDQTDAQKAKKPKTPKNNKWTGGQSNHGGSGEHVFTPQDLLDALVEDAVEADAATQNDYDVKEMAQQAFTATDTEGLKEANAETVAVGITQALETFVTAASPMWQNRIDHGVIDALAFRTKDIGSQDFHRFLEMNNNQGLDVHLSILSDVSYSMQPYMGKLSEFMYAAGRACQNVGIQATYTLWSSGTENYRIWQGGNIRAEVFPAMGGTDPTEALDDLATHNPEKADKHLVLVFTDGEWAHNFPSLQRWSDEGRTIVFIRYGAGRNEKLDMGADRHIIINKLEDLPELLTQSLIDVLSFGN